MLNRLISIVFIVFIALTSVVFYLAACLLWLITRPFDPRLVVLHQFTSFWAALYLWTMPAWSVKAVGRHKIRPKATYMVVSNHQSQLDILIAFRLFFHFKWVSKAEVFKLPLIGWNMVLNEYIKIKRGDKESVDRLMQKCEETIASGSSVFFFPEGTRSRDGRMRPFKTGAFVIAKKMKVPILPIAINGSKDALPKHSLNFHGRHTMRIEVLDEIPYTEFQHLSIEETAALTSQRIAVHVDEHQQDA